MVNEKIQANQSRSHTAPACWRWISSLGKGPQACSLWLRGKGNLSSSVPEGRQHVALGVSPGNPSDRDGKAPEGRKQNTCRDGCFRPSGAMSKFHSDPWGWRPRLHASATPWLGNVVLFRFRILQLFFLPLLTLSLFAEGVDKDDWASELLGAARSPESTGILGMSSDDLESYVSTRALDEGDDEVPDDFIQHRRRFVIREMKFNADWETDPTALPAFIDQFKRRTGMKALALQPRKPLSFEDEELTDWPFIYMTAHNAFSLSEDESRGLRHYLDNGGFLNADDCLYGFPFGKSFPGQMSKVYSDREMTPLDPKHAVFGVALKQLFHWEKTNEVGLPMVMKPNAFSYLEVDGYMAVLYTPHDLGCHWEISSPPTPSNPIGVGMHNLDRIPGSRETAYRMGVNLVIFSMLH